MHKIGWTAVIAAVALRNVLYQYSVFFTRSLDLLSVMHAQCISYCNLLFNNPTSLLDLPAL